MTPRREKGLGEARAALEGVQGRPSHRGLDRGQGRRREAVLVLRARRGVPRERRSADEEAEIAEVAKRLGISKRVAKDLVKENDQFLDEDDKRLFFMRKYTALRAKGMDWLRASTRAQELMERKFPDE